MLMENALDPRLRYGFCLAASAEFAIHPYSPAPRAADEAISDTLPGMTMDDEAAMLTPSGPLDLTIDWQAAAPPLAAHAAEHVRERWAVYLAEAQARGAAMFEGTITQLLAANCQRVAGGTGLNLRLAPGQYSDFLVTRLRDRAWFAQHAGGCGVAALGNSALVTRGDHVLFGRRSPRVSCYAERLHMIGGVLEGLDTPAFPATPTGIQAHLRMELQEEIGLRLGEERRDGWPRVMGLAVDPFLGQPELFWQWEMTIDLEALRQRVDPAEHSAAVIIGRGEMNQTLWGQLTPVTRQAWRLWTNGA